MKTPLRTLVVIEHHALPEDDAAVAHLAARGFALRRVHPWRGEALPDPAEADGALILGGPQMVTDLDAAPYLRDEKDFALRLLERETPMLAVCLGAQLLANALGAEVGWHPEGAVAFGFHGLRPTAAAGGMFPEGLRVLSGNAQGFELPAGAELLAEGDLWPNQAYRVGSALALQFHPEVTRTILDEWQRELADYAGRKGADDAATQDADFARHDPALKVWLRATLDGMFGLAPAPV